LDALQPSNHRQQMVSVAQGQKELIAMYKTLNLLMKTIHCGRRTLLIPGIRASKEGSSAAGALQDTEPSDDH
jgi:hypothetical protein